MNRGLRRNLTLALAAVGLLVLPVGAGTLDATNPPPVPPLPTIKSPVDTFRELLALPPDAQRAALASRPEASRQRLQAKLREYKFMDPDERELRLLATELSWHLPPLLALAPSNRMERLADVRADLRALLESRLARWDALPAELRAQVLQNETAMSVLLQMGAASERMREQMAAELAPELRVTIERALARLDAMKAAERAHAFEAFESFFSMTSAEKERNLRVMSDVEKRQMEQTLAAFGQLPAEQRRACIRSFEKFARMSPAERALFYRNAQRWEQMTPKERQEWREVVKNVEILPPVSEPKTKLPPLPPDPAPRVTTNKT